MDLQLYFEPIPDHILDDALPIHSFQRSIFINRDIFYETEGIDVALIGLQEYRGDERGFGTVDAAHEIRKQLYKLSRTTGRNRILDLGNLRSGPTLEDSYQRIREVVQYLREKKIVVVLFGGTHDLDIGQYLAYEELDQLVTFCAVDARLDLEDVIHMPASNHFNRLLRYDPNFLSNFIHLGYQSYMVDDGQLNILDKLHFEAMRLGELKNHINETEPLIRMSDLLSFDLSSVQSVYCPGTTDPAVFGFTGEEACQIAWFAGQSDKISSFGLYNFDPGKDVEDKRTAQVAATMLWYFLEGFYQRKHENIKNLDEFIQYEVHMGGQPESIRFIKSKKSEKWWMEIQVIDPKSVFSGQKWIACNYSDYQTACSGEIPNRWLRALSRMG